MPSYNRLTADNRIELYALNKAGLNAECHCGATQRFTFDDQP